MNQININCIYYCQGGKCDCLERGKFLGVFIGVFRRDCKRMYFDSYCPYQEEWILPTIETYGKR